MFQLWMGHVNAVQIMLQNDLDMFTKPVTIVHVVGPVLSNIYAVWKVNHLPYLAMGAWGDCKV